MQLLEANNTTILESTRQSEADASLDDTLATPRVHSKSEGWRTVINESLLEWIRDPSQLIDDGVTPPSKDVLRLALHLAMTWRKKGIAAPHRVVLDGDGGIVFKRMAGDITETIEITDTGIEVIGYHNYKIIHRKKLLELTPHPRS